MKHRFITGGRPQDTGPLHIQHILLSRKYTQYSAPSQNALYALGPAR